MNLSNSPQRPACPSRASGWSSLTTPWGLPCCVRFPCVHAVATTPAQRLGVLLCSFHPAVSAFPERVVGSACASTFRGLLGVHSRYGLHTRAVTIYRDTHPEGFSYFVTSIAAPVASGWSNSRVGLTPTGKRRLSTAHTLRRSARLGARELDHLAPLLGFLGHDPSEVGGGTRKGCSAEVGKSRLDLWVAEARIDLLIEPVDDVEGCVLGAPRPNVDSLRSRGRTRRLSGHPVAPPSASRSSPQALAAYRP